MSATCNKNGKSGTENRTGTAGFMQTAHDRNKKSRGQVLTIDFVLSLGVFLAAFYILFTLWGVVQSVLLLNMSELEMSKVAVSVSQSLVSTPGQDSNWHVISGENSSAFGLAWRSNMLQTEKVDEFISLNATNYTMLKEKLGAGKYELYVFIDELDGTRLHDFGMQSPDASRKHATQSSQRFAILDGRIVILQVEVWSYIYA